MLFSRFRAVKHKAEELRMVLAHNRAEALKLTQKAGIERTRKMLATAQKDLERRLWHAEILNRNEDDTFTMAQMRSALSQIKLVTKQILVPKTKAIVLDTGAEAAESGVQHTVDYLMRADAAFRGIGTQPLALREASMFEVGAQGARASILRRMATSGTPEATSEEVEFPHPAKLGILERYGVETIGSFENVLQKGLLAKKSWSDIRDDLTDVSPFLQRQPKFWAERIVRTEAMGAYNRAAYHANVEADEQLGDMCKAISSVFDDRTGSDSYAVHGQFRRPEEPFETWYGPMLHPPERPNDRAVVVPHRISWPIPKYLEPKEREQIVARWIWEGRKGAPPETPLITTIDFELFGKQEPPKLKEKNEDEEEDEKRDEEEGDDEA